MDWVLEVLRDAVDSTTAGLVVLDDDGAILFANDSAVAMLGVTGDAPGQANITDYLAPLEQLREMGSGADASRAEVRPPGQERTFGFTLTPLRGGGPAGGRCVLLFQDISLLLGLRAERDRLLKLAAVGETLPTVLHELRNPMARLTTALEVLIEDCADDGMRQRLHAVLGEARRVNLGLEGMGTVGKDLRVGRHHAIDHTVRETCKLMQGAARDAGIDLRIEVQDMPLLPLDVASLKGVLFNLLNNAMAATSGGGYIRVAARCDSRERRLSLSVSDNGSGMSEEVRVRCTELFYTTKKRGSGIGLALCKQIIEGAGGRVEIDSELGRGTTIRLEVPTDLHRVAPVSGRYRRTDVRGLSIRFEERSSGQARCGPQGGAFAVFTAPRLR